MAAPNPYLSIVERSQVRLFSPGYREDSREPGASDHHAERMIAQHLVAELLPSLRAVQLQTGSALALAPRSGGSFAATEIVCRQQFLDAVTRAGQPKSLTPHEGNVKKRTPRSANAVVTSSLDH